MTLHWIDALSQPSAPPPPRTVWSRVKEYAAGGVIGLALAFIGACWIVGGYNVVRFLFGAVT